MEQGMDAAAQTPASVLGVLGRSLPLLLADFGIVLGLLIVGILIYMAVTPFHERELMRQGNAAASTVLGGALVALAIPLAALLATTGGLLDILVWGIVAVVLQLVTVTVVSLLMRGMRSMIDAGQVAAAIPVVAAQISIGLLNAAAMVPV
jgi:putative membrane protein